MRITWVRGEDRSVTRSRRTRSKPQIGLAFAFDWNRIVPLLGDGVVRQVCEQEERGKVVMPLAPPTRRLMMPTETVNVLVDSDVCGMIMASPSRTLGATTHGYSGGALIRVEEENWGFSGQVQLRCVVTERFRLGELLVREPLRLATVELVHDVRPDGINEELEALVAMREVSRVLDDIGKLEQFLSERMHLLSDVSASLDGFLRFAKQVRCYRDVAKEESRDSPLSEGEVLSFALLRSLSLGDDEKVVLLKSEESLQRLRFAEVELKQGLQALKEFTLENYEDAPPQFRD